MDTISWTSLLSPVGSATSNYFVMAFVFMAQCINTKSVNTMEELWLHLTWSLAAAYHGVHPLRDPYGRLFTEEDGAWFSRAGSALASGYFLVLWTIKCDLDFVAKGFGLPSHNGNRCHLCDCNSLDLSLIHISEPTRPY